jgi:hypothetical protein
MTLVNDGTSFSGTTGVLGSVGAISLGTGITCLGIPGSSINTPNGQVDVCNIFTDIVNAIFGPGVKEYFKDGPDAGSNPPNMGPGPSPDPNPGGHLGKGVGPVTVVKGTFDCGSKGARDGGKTKMPSFDEPSGGHISFRILDGLIISYILEGALYNAMFDRLRMLGLGPSRNLARANPGRSLPGPGMIRRRIGDFPDSTGAPTSEMPAGEVAVDPTDWH